MLEVLDVFVEDVESSKRPAYILALEEAKQGIATSVVIDTVNALNEMLECDPFTVNKIFSDMTACRETLALSPAEISRVGESHYIGILGIINGCLRNNLKIVPVFTEGASNHPYPIQKFTVIEV